MVHNKEYNLRKIDVYEFKRIFKNYLVNDFPILEKKPFIFLARMYNNNQYSCYVLELDNEIKAYASFVWKNEEVLLLDYFAVVSKERGLGIGSKMILLLKKELKDKIILLECEDPEKAKSNEDKNQRNRRISFYLKNGADMSGTDIKVFGVRYKVLVINKKIRKELLVNTKYEISEIYTNMFPKFIFKNAQSVV